jgi:hypothetical protein
MKQSVMTLKEKRIGRTTTTVIKILDSLSEPNPDQARAAKAAGVAAWFGYVGGPEAAGVWDGIGFTMVRNVGLTAGGFWVGLGDPQQALRAAQAAGLLSGSVIGHDVETAASVAGLSDAVAASFSAALRSGGYRPVLYGLPAICAARGAHYDAVWVAGGPSYRTGTPVQTDPRGLVSISQNQAWQWYATHDFHGIGVDESIADDWFAGEDMTLDTARLHVWGWYTNYCGRVATQSEVDFWAQKLMAENPEAVITEFYTTPEAEAYRARTPAGSHTHTVSGTLTATTSPPTGA